MKTTIFMLLALALSIFGSTMLYDTYGYVYPLRLYVFMIQFGTACLAAVAGYKFCYFHYRVGALLRWIAVINMYFKGECTAEELLILIDNIKKKYNI